MATVRIGIDKTHGFMQDIITNQFDRKKCELEGSIEKELRLQNVDEFEKKMKEERRKKREKIPTRQTYIPPSQRKTQLAPARYLGRTIFKMEIEYENSKFAPLRIRESECIKTACELFINRHNMPADMVRNIEAHIQHQMGLASFSPAT